MIKILKNGLNIKKNYVENSKCNIVITHGLCEYLERYENITKFLNDNNINVIRYDLKGHGKSDGKRGYIKSINTFLGDLNFVIREIRKDNPGLKTFLLGHSLGAGISNIYSLNYSNISGVISIAGPFGLVKGKEYARFIPLFLAKLLKYKTILFENEGLSNNKEFLKEYINDKNLLPYFYAIVPGCVIKYGHSVLKRKNKNTNIPYLFMQGRKDRIVNIEVPYKFFKYINSNDKEFFIQENGGHDLLNDLEKDITFEKIKDWILKRV